MLSKWRSHISVRSDELQLHLYFSILRTHKNILTHFLRNYVNKMLLVIDMLDGGMYQCFIQLTEESHCLTIPTTNHSIQHSALYYTRLYKTYKIFNSLPVSLQSSFIHFPGLILKSQVLMQNHVWLFLCVAFIITCSDVTNRSGRRGKSKNG